MPDEPLLLSESELVLLGEFELVLLGEFEVVLPGEYELDLPGDFELDLPVLLAGVELELRGSTNVEVDVPGSRWQSAW